MNFQQLQKHGIEELQNANILDARRKINRLLRHITGWDLTELLKNEKEEIAESIKNTFESGVEKLKEGYPIQYLTQQQEFMKLPFFVNEAVLIPQPDTEILVEETLKEIEKKEKVEILDLCTGSGCIGISIAVYAEQIQKVVLSDISEKALEIADKNRKRNQVEEKTQTVQSDLFQSISQKFDGIVSNPPYIQTQIIKTLSKEVQHEPRLALDGGEDGLDFYRKILEEADFYLKPGGFLFFEIGYDQKEAVKKIWQDLRKQGKTKLNKWDEKKDLAGLDRVILLRSE